MTFRYMAVGKCQDISRIQHKQASNQVTKSSTWKLLLADEPTRDQEGTNLLLEDLLLERWYWKTCLKESVFICTDL